MSEHPVTLALDGPIALVTLNDPARRNALGEAMFEALDAALEQVRASEARVVHLRGAGPAFCAGFDLEAALRNRHLMASFIERLSRANRTLRRLPQVIVAEVHGAAIAGGCAMLSACDFVIAAPDATLGYPVHLIGVSPAVTIPTLAQAIGPGAARRLLMGGALIDGHAAMKIGLATHLATSAEALPAAAGALCKDLAAKPPAALRITKAWLNEIDGSLDDERFDASAGASAAIASSTEAARLLAAHWQRRRERERRVE